MRRPNRLNQWSFRKGRTAAPLAVALVASALVLLRPASSAALTTADIGDPAGPLTHIYITSQTNCQVAHTGDSNFELYEPSSTTGDCGTFLVVDPGNEGGTLYGPEDCLACGSTGPRTPWTEVSQTQSGHSVVTVVDAGTSGIRLTETDSYSPGQESFLSSLAIQNTDTSSHTLVLYRAGDCFLGNTDEGFGQTFPGGGIACAASTEPNSRIEEWVPVTIGSHYYEAFFDSVWAGIGSHGDFPDTCDCNIFEDNGAGLSWRTTLLAGRAATYSHLTNFSPTGSLVLTMTKTADSSIVAPGDQDGYTITVNNPNESAVALDSVTDDLPGGFSYVPGSTSGMTSDDPSISGQTLTWNGSFPVPGGGSDTLHFNVIVAETPGEYFNQASATAEGFSVAPTGPTAQITVTGTQPEADLSITKTDGNPDPCPGGETPIPCGPDPVSSGRPVAYGISVANAGPDPATGVTVTDTPQTIGATAQSGFGTGWTCTVDTESNTVTCAYSPTLDPGDTAEPLTVVVKAPTSTTDTSMTDEASVSADQADPNSENNTASEDTAVTGSGNQSSKNHAEGFFDNINTLTIATTRDQTSRFYSSLTIHPDPGLEPAVVTIDEVPPSQYPTLCGGKLCDAQVQVTGLPLGQAAANNAMQVHWFYVKDTKQGSTVWVRGDQEPFATPLRNCITRGIADPPKCVNSRRVLRNGDRDIMLLWRNGGDPWGGKR
ncbi:MAG: DUF11 domain-containing protein [Actinobacteria bacterium]|nr:MAG: DUF11 domain-containing protein [Actinomycetota bacterium]